MGGSSAFGAKAGDIFTRITIITASIWIAFCLIALFWSKHHGDVLGASDNPPASCLPGPSARAVHLAQPPAHQRIGKFGAGRRSKIRTPAKYVCARFFV